MKDTVPVFWILPTRKKYNRSKMSESALLTSVTLSSQVKNHILNLIAEQKLTPGMPVPSEIQLIQKLGVSRGIVREAYRSLAALGILETHSGKVPRIKNLMMKCCAWCLDLPWRPNK